jgi:hypothetical protein
MNDKKKLAKIDLNGREVLPYKHPKTKIRFTHEMEKALVYSPELLSIHVLNPLGASVLTLCDGVHELNDILIALNGAFTESQKAASKQSLSADIENFLLSIYNIGIIDFLDCDQKISTNSEEFVAKDLFPLEPLRSHTTYTFLYNKKTVAVIDRVNYEVVLINRSACSIWELCDGSKSIKTIILHIKNRHFDVPFATIVEDVIKCFLLFKKFGFVSW